MQIGAQVGHLLLAHGLPHGAALVGKVLAGGIQNVAQAILNRLRVGQDILVQGLPRALNVCDALNIPPDGLFIGVVVQSPVVWGDAPGLALEAVRNSGVASGLFIFRDCTLENGVQTGRRGPVLDLKPALLLQKLNRALDKEVLVRNRTALIVISGDQARGEVRYVLDDVEIPLVLIGRQGDVVPVLVYATGQLLEFIGVPAHLGQAVSHVTEGVVIGLSEVLRVLHKLLVGLGQRVICARQQRDQADSGQDPSDGVTKKQSFDARRQTDVGLGLRVRRFCQPDGRQGLPHLFLGESLGDHCGLELLRDILALGLGQVFVVRDKTADCVAFSTHHSLGDLLYGVSFFVCLDGILYLLHRVHKTGKVTGDLIVIPVCDDGGEGGGYHRQDRIQTDDFPCDVCQDSQGVDQELQHI